MKKELLRDAGKIRNCTSNVYKMNYIELMIYDLRYLFPSELKEMLLDFLTNLFYCVSYILIIFLFPFFILIRVHNRKMRAKKEMMEYEKDNK